MRTLATLFRGPLGQSYLAFRQATLQCEDAAFEKGRYFHKICDQVAAAVSLHPELLVFLRELSRYSNVGVVVFSSGLREVWDIVLKREGLLDTVQVIGGGVYPTILSLLLRSEVLWYFVFATSMGSMFEHSERVHWTCRCCKRRIKLWW